MIEVTFTSYPKNGKKLFKTGVFKQKPLSLKEANERIKKYATTLSAHESQAISFTILKDDGGEEMDQYDFDTQIEAGDTNFGIINLISRENADEELSDEEDEDLENLQEAVEKELGLNAVSYEDQLEPDYSKETKLESNTSHHVDKVEESALQEKEQSTSGMEENKEVPEELPEESEDLPAANYNDDPVDPLPDLVEPSNLPNDTHQEDFETVDLPDPTSEFVAQNQERAAPVQPPAEATVIPSSEYENPEDIFEKIPKNFQSESFDLSVIKQQLGYKLSPTDRFDEELNRAIDEIFKNTGLSVLQSNYDIARSNLENSLIEALTTKYNTITKDTVDSTVAKRLQDKINDLEADAENNKVKNQENFEKACSTEEDRLTAEDTARLEQFKVQLQNEHRENMRSFKVNQEKQLDALNEKIDSQLQETKEDLKHREHDKVVNERNQALSDARVEASNNFSQGVKDEYTKSSETFRVCLDSAINLIQEKSDEIGQKREKYNLEQAKIAQQEKANELKARELDQKEKELALTQKQIESLPDAIATALSKNQSSQVQAIPMNPIPNNYYYAQVGAPNVSVPPTPSNKELSELREKYETLQKQLADSQLAAKETELTEAKKELATTKSSKKHWQAGLVSFLAVVALSTSAFVIADKMNQQTSANKGNPSVALVKNAEKSKEKPSSSKKQDSSSKKTVKTPSVTIKTPEEKYDDLKDWSEKVDYLNGLVGQKDVRALQVINRKDPTNLSKLYLAIAENNQKDIRDTWLKMTAEEKRTISDSSRNAVVLAFYAVKDWHNGWLAHAS